MTSTAADLEIRFSSDTKGAERGIDQMAGKVRGLGGVMQTALGFAAGSFIRDAVRGFGDLIGGALDFEAAMANVNSIAQLSGTQIDALGDQVNALATDTAQAPQVLAKGLYDIYSSGFQGAAAIDVLTASANAATAGLTTTDVAVRGVTAVMNAYGQETYTAAQVSDIMFQTVNDGVITFDMLSNNMGNTLPIANALGISFEELAAAYAQMTLKGVSGAQAETQIASLMKSAANPTDALTQAVTDYGYANTQALIDAEGMPGFLKAVYKEANGNQAAMYDMLGTQEAVNAALILGQDDAAGYTAELDKMKNSAGATDKALAKQMQSAQFQLRKAKIAVQQAATVFIGTLAPGIALAAEGFTALVTHGLIPAVEWFDHIMQPVRQFGGLLGEAFGEGQGVDDLMRAMFGPLSPLNDAPQIVKDTAHALLDLADSFGDLYSAFKTGGLSGLSDQIGEEVGTILDSVGELANIALDVVVDVASWAVGKIPDIWDWLMGVIGVGHDATGDTRHPGRGHHQTANVTLTDVLVDVAGWALGEVADLWGWLMGELGVGSGGTYTSGELIGLPTGQAPVTLTDVLVDVLSWGVGEIVDLWGWLKDNVGSALVSLSGVTVDVVSWSAGEIADLWGWLQGAVTGGGASTGGFIPPPIFGGAGAGAGVSLSDVIVDVASWVKGTIVDISGDLSTWIQDFLDTHEGVSATLDKWTLYLNDPSNVNVPDLDGPATEEAKKKSTTVLLAEWYLTLTGEPQTTGNQEDVSSSIQTWLDDNITDAFTLETLTVNTPVVGSIIGFPKAVNDALNALEPVQATLDKLDIDFSPLWPNLDLTQFGVGLGVRLREEIGKVFGGRDVFHSLGMGGFTTHEDGLGAQIMDFLKIDLSDVAAPILPDWMTNYDWITGPVDDLVSAIEGAVQDLKNAWNDLQFWKDRSDDPNAVPPIPAGMQGPPDLSVATSADIQRAITMGQTLNPANVPQGIVKIDADTSLFDDKFSGIKSRLDDYVQSHKSATLDFDTGPAAIKYTEAYGWGSVFDAAIFQATLDFDTGPAAIAYTDAFGWGDTFAAQTFTASLSFDTSALDTALAHAYAVVGEIASIMPHSPADRGPLSRPISFGYIADNLLATMDAMRGHADRGMNELADRMNRRVGIGGIGYGASGGLGGSAARQITVNPTLHINAPVYGVNDLRKTIQDAFVDEAFPALFDAIDRQDRANGAQA